MSAQLLFDPNTLLLYIGYNGNIIKPVVTAAAIDPESLFLTEDGYLQVKRSDGTIADVVTSAGDKVCLKGLKGQDGENGKDGNPGKDGDPGKDGESPFTEDEVENILNSVEANRTLESRITLQVLQITEDNSDLAKRIDTIDGRTSSVEEAQHSLSTAVTTLENSVSSIIGGVQTTIQNTEARVGTIETDVQTLRNSVADVPTIKLDLSNCIADLSSNTTSLNTLNSRFENSVTMLQGTIDTITAVQLPSVSSNITSLSETLSEVQTSTSLISSTVTTLGDTVSGLNTTVSTLPTQSSLDALNQAIQNLSTEFNNYKTKNAWLDNVNTDALVNTYPNPGLPPAVGVE